MRYLSQRKALFTLKKAELHFILHEEKHSQVLSLGDNTRTHILYALKVYNMHTSKTSKKQSLSLQTGRNRHTDSLGSGE